MTLITYFNRLTLLSVGLLLATPSLPAQESSVRSLEANGGIFAKPGDGTRSYLKTVQGDLAKSSFQAEATVTLKGGGGSGCAFFGLGRGAGDSRHYGEPAAAPSLYLRLAPSDFSGGVVTVTANGREIGNATAAVGDGTHRLRLTWDAAGRRVLFEIDANWNGQAFKADASATATVAEIDFGTTGHVFAGGANGVAFSGFALKPLSAAEIKAAGFGESFANDPTARTWLPVGDAAAAPAPEVDQFLKSLNGSMRLLGCWYNGATLAASRGFTRDGLKTASTQWSGEIRATPVKDEKDALDLAITVKLADGRIPAAGIAAAFDFADWSTANYVLIPSSVYNGNRNRIVGRGYNSGLDRKELYNKDLQITHGEVPNLALEPGKRSKLEVSSCNAATPTICFFSPAKKRGFILLAEQGIRNAQGQIIDNAFAVEENADRTRATLVVGAPGVRERKPEFIGFSGSPDRGIALKPGDTIAMRLRLYSFDAPDIPALLEKFMAVRKAITGPNQPRNQLPQSQTIAWMTERIDARWHAGKNQFYCPENADWISFGWIGGLMNTFPMLALGDDLHLDRVAKTFDFGLKAQGRSGYYYGCIDANGKPFGREAYDDHQEIVLTRKNADVLFWMIKQFELLKAQGKAAAIRPEWEQSMRRLADAFAATWKKHGQWGNNLNVETGDVAIYNTTGGIMACGGLALASKYFNEPGYLKIAEEAAGFYYQRDFVRLGFTTGACADIMQNADSETAAGLMTALMALYDITGDPKWLELSRNAANLAATWTVSYDYELPKSTDLGRNGAKLAGIYWASTQNKHGAPGICTSSGDPLFKIYRATGDRRYADLMRDILHAHAEGVRPGGLVNERLTFCDADSRGELSPWVTGWNELNGILMAMEIPGIYLRLDKDELFVFDHVEAKVIKRDEAGATLQITNPTKFDARVAIFAETAKQAEKPLGCTAFLTWPKAEVKAGETRTVVIAPDGTIKR